MMVSLSRPWTNLGVLSLALSLVLVPVAAGNSWDAPVDSGKSKAEAKAAVAAPQRDLLDRVVVLGASASAGFGVRFTTEHPTGTPVARPLNLASVLEVILPARTTLSSESTAFFFTSPLETGERQVDAALEAEPTLIVAIDYLFWYGYGVAGGEDRADEDARRLARLEVGLAQLERLGDVPVVLGDLPDMSDSVGRMLRERQMPSPNALAAMNRRIHEWSEGRPTVRQFPLSSLIDQMRSGQALTVGTIEWTAEAAHQSLQWDRLHPSVDGLIIMAQQAMVCLRPAGLDDAAEPSRWMEAVVMDTDSIRRRLRQRTIDRAASPVPAGS